MLPGRQRCSAAIAACWLLLAGQCWSYDKIHNVDLYQVICTGGAGYYDVEVDREQLNASKYHPHVVTLLRSGGRAVNITYTVLGDGVAWALGNQTVSLMDSNDTASTTTTTTPMTTTTIESPRRRARLLKHQDAEEDEDGQEGDHVEEALDEVMEEMAEDEPLASPRRLAGARSRYSSHSRSRSYSSYSRSRYYSSYSRSRYYSYSSHRSRYSRSRLHCGHRSRSGGSCRSRYTYSPRRRDPPPRRRTYTYTPPPRRRTYTYTPPPRRRTYTYTPPPRRRRTTTTRPPSPPTRRRATYVAPRRRRSTPPPTTTTVTKAPALRPGGTRPSSSSYAPLLRPTYTTVEAPRRRSPPTPRRRATYVAPRRRGSTYSSSTTTPRRRYDSAGASRWSSTGTGGTSYGYASPTQLASTYPTTVRSTPYGYSGRSAYGYSKSSAALAMAAGFAGGAAVTASTFYLYRAYASTTCEGFACCYGCSNSCFTSSNSECKIGVGGQLVQDDLMAAGFYPDELKFPVAIRISSVVGDDYTQANICPPTTCTNFTSCTTTGPVNTLWVTLTQLEELDDSEMGAARPGAEPLTGLATMACAVALLFVLRAVIRP